jgi:ATP-dependent Clp protease protease subunit
MRDRRCELAAPESREKEREASMLSERLLESRTILLAEPITKEVAERLTAKLLLLDQESDKELINIYINSPGGDVDAGFAIFDVVRYISAPVRCISTGLTASAAVVVLLATPKKLRLSLPNSRFLMHQPSMGIHGSAADVRIEANEILKMREKINKLIAEETGQPLDKVEKGTRRNYWMDAEEAKKYGLVSRIIKSKSEIAE